MLPIQITIEVVRKYANQVPSQTDELPRQQASWILRAVTAKKNETEPQYEMGKDIES